MKHILLGLALLASTSPLGAATYVKANFDGQLGSTPNVKPPFRNNGFVGGQSVTGSFVYQTDLVPGSGTGFQNVFFDNFADAATIPDADDFTIDFGPFTWTKADNLDAERLAGIQYNNGVFNGFVFLTNFTFQGQDYRFNLEGSVISVRLLSGGFPTGSSLINGTLNSPAFGGAAYTPPVVTPPTPGVPEPATWAMMIAGLGLTGAAMRARKSAVAFA